MAALIILVLIVAYAAFAAWLAVRIINRRERWAKWALATAASLPVLYAVSFGPACWLDSRRKPDAKHGQLRPIPFHASILMNTVC